MVKNVTVEQAHQQQGEGATYVDVRSVPEFEAGHPAGAVNVPLLNQDEHTGQMVPNREFLAVMQANFPAATRLLIGCQVGGRSAQAAQLLASSGYRDVTNVLGGFGGARPGMPPAPGWAQSGLPVETGTPSAGSYAEMRARAEGGNG